MPFTPWVSVAGNTPLPLPVSAGGTGAASAALGLANLGGLVKQAATPAAGYTKVNGTGNIISWTAPADGSLHRALIWLIEDVSVAETGGQLDIGFTAPDGTALLAQIAAGGLGLGVHVASSNLFTIMQSGSTVTLSQNTALTAGASVVWGEIWGL